MRALFNLLALLSCSVYGAAAADTADVGYGPNPKLPPPDDGLIPTVNVAPVAPFERREGPNAVNGLKVAEFASGLDHPRWLYTLENGDVLVAETNAPPRPDDGRGIKGFAMKLLMKKAGSTGQSANRISLLRDRDRNGVADIRETFLGDLNSPFGMALSASAFYVANTDALVRFEYVKDATRLTGPGTKVADLPAGTINHHWTKNVIASPDGAQLFVTVGSNSNVAENGLDKELNRAAILKIDAKSGATEVYASGLRNPVGLAFEPETRALWTTVNERDELGNDLVPDYLTSVKEGAFYGWPYSYFGQNVDTRVSPQDAERVARSILPDYALGAHTASLGLLFQRPGSKWPEDFREGAFVAQHGSWNRKPFAGYKVIFVPFRNGKPDGRPKDVLTGFLNDRGEAMGRPVGLAFDASGALLVADDVGNRIWRVAPATEPQHVNSD